MKALDMGDTCSLLLVRRSAISLCSYEIYDYINYDYLILKYVDSNTCILSIGC
jgi:hypothetical protein